MSFVVACLSFDATFELCNVLDRRFIFFIIPTSSSADSNASTTLLRYIFTCLSRRLLFARTIRRGLVCSANSRNILMSSRLIRVLFAFPIIAATKLSPEDAVRAIESAMVTKERAENCFSERPDIGSHPIAQIKLTAHSAPESSHLSALTVECVTSSCAVSTSFEPAWHDVISSVLHYTASRYRTGLTRHQCSPGSSPEAAAHPQ